MSNVTSGQLWVDGKITGSNLIVPGDTFKGHVYSSVIVQSGGDWEADATIASGGSIVISQGGTVSGTTVLNGGSITSYNSTSGKLAFTWGTSGGTLELKSGAVDHAETPKAGNATILVDSGATLSSAILQSGNTLQVSGGGRLFGATVNTGATVILSSGSTASSLALSGGTVDAYTLPKFVTGHFTSGKLILESGVSDGGYNQPNSGITIQVKSGALLSNSTMQGASDITLVQSGGTASGIKLDNYGNLAVAAGGKASATTVGSNGYFALAGSAVSTTITQAGKLEIASGGIATSNTVTSGQVSVDAGGTLNSATVQGSSLNANGQSVPGVIVSGGGTMSSVTVQDWANLRVSAGGSAVNTVVNSRGGLSLAGSATGTTVNTSGVMNITSGGAADNTTIATGGEAYVGSAGTLGNTTVASTGIVSIDSGGVLSGQLTLQDGGSATLWNTAGGVVDLQGDTNGGLVISGLTSGGTVSTVISGFNGSAAGNSDSIELAGLKSADVASVTYPSADQVALALTNGSTVTLNIPGVESHGFTVSDGKNGWLDYEVCFLSGSMIQTPHGEVAVETLGLGDEVIAYVDGLPQSRRVVWAGKSHATVRPHLAEDEAGYPVRILENAISQGVPYKDMLITPEHCLFFYGRFVPARMLVNGVSIFYDTSITSYDYYHVETEEHSVLRADGMLTESYLDTGNRSAFRQAGSVIGLGAGRRDWTTDAAVPLCIERAFVEPLFHSLVARAAAASGQEGAVTLSEQTMDPDLHLVTQTGAVVRPVYHKAAQYRFMLPPGVTSVRIVSRASRPTDTVGPFVDDRRMLGVAIASVQLITADQTQSITTHLQADKPAGWYATDTSHAWTDGNASLPLPALAKKAMSMLCLEVCAAGPYRLADQAEEKTVAQSA
ncbi:outer membrane protein [Acetobacter malorum]|nr:outer membrane protein [Acetobacter malorum]